MHLIYSISEQMMDKGKFLSIFCGALLVCMYRIVLKRLSLFFQTCTQCTCALAIHCTKVRVRCCSSLTYLVALQRENSRRRYKCWRFFGHYHDWRPFGIIGHTVVIYVPSSAKESVRTYNIWGYPILCLGRKALLMLEAFAKTYSKLTLQEHW